MLRWESQMFFLLSISRSSPLIIPFSEANACFWQPIASLMTSISICFLLEWGGHRISEQQQQASSLRDAWAPVLVAVFGA